MHAGHYREQLQQIGCEQWEVGNDIRVIETDPAFVAFTTKLEELRAKQNALKAKWIEIAEDFAND